MSEIIYGRGLIKFQKLFVKELVAISLVSLFSVQAFADAKSQAYRLHNRLTGVPPTSDVLSQMETLIKNGNPKGAALKAIDNQNFYNLTLKNWVKRWTNVDHSPRVPLNDYVATVIGMVRDDIPFDQVLYGDHLYIAAANTPVTVPAYSNKDNKQYETLENNFVSLKDYLVHANQSEVTGIKDTAGVITTRASAAAFFSAGTNRRMTRFTFINYLCRDFEAVHDINIADFHVRRDVERNPGGDSRTYRNQCVGCHAGQDGLGGAWAYFDFVGDQLTYTPGTVAPKILKNVLYKDGYLTKDDSWVNLWADGQNAVLGWPDKVSGNGAKELGMMVSRSRAFAECMSSKVFELVCIRKPKIASEIAEVKTLADSFQSGDKFNMKNLFAETSVLCLGE
ncbi:MAG: hypothetical protein H7177_15965 [Rhizobacter sp.]|nr:hypothetical protein [Bacteriovorax sp.]